MFVRLLFLSLIIAAIAAIPPWRHPGIPKPAPRAAGVMLGYGLGGERELDILGQVWYSDYEYKGAPWRSHRRLFSLKTGWDLAPMRAVAQAYRGEWWQFGNEPNDPNQDNVSPAEYAQRYHDFYFALKRTDPGARVLPAGLAGADWKWAEDFRDEYRKRYGTYPRVDGWNIHNYLLEHCEDALEVPAFQTRIVAFRQWMDRIGDREKPLFLTEYGVLYGNGCCNCPLFSDAQVTGYMQATTQWLEQSGAVQAWAWFAVQTDGRYNGDLLTPDSKLTRFGIAYRNLAQPNPGER